MLTSETFQNGKLELKYMRCWLKRTESSELICFMKQMNHQTSFSFPSEVKFHWIENRNSANFIQKKFRLSGESSNKIRMSSETRFPLLFPSRQKNHRCHVQSSKIAIENSFTELMENWWKSRWKRCANLQEMKKKSACENDIAFSSETLQRLTFSKRKKCWSSFICEAFDNTRESHDRTCWVERKRGYFRCIRMRNDCTGVEWRAGKTSLWGFRNDKKKEEKRRIGSKWRIGWKPWKMFNYTRRLLGAFWTICHTFN